jgi:hypothetical protein
MIATQDFKVDPLVWFMIESLSPDNRAEVEAVLRSPETFARLADRPGAVKEFATDAGPIFTLNVTPRYLAIFRKSAEGVDVFDFMSQGALDFMRSSGSKRQSVEPERRPAIEDLGA